MSDLARTEVMPNGMVRMYFASARQGHLRIEYTVVCTAENAAKIARTVLQIASNAHNVALWQNDGETAH